MSYFVFGVIEGAQASGRQSIGGGIDVCWGATLQQAVVLEILENHGKPASTETPFGVVVAGEDNADGLVSPYQVSRDQIGENLSYFLAWLDNQRTGRGAELWVTEGYDDTFMELQGSSGELDQELRTVLQKTEDVPSVRLRFKTSRV